MLVLSRKLGERLVIGDDVVLIVNKIAGNRVTLAIEAPNQVRIVRGELSPLDNSDRQNASTGRCDLQQDESDFAAAGASSDVGIRYC